MTSNISCASCRELLPWYVAETLTPADRTAVEAHLAGCADCQREVAFWRAVGETLEAVTPEPSVSLPEAESWRAIQRKIALAPILPLAARNHAKKERPLMSERELNLPPAEPAPIKSSSSGSAQRWPYVALVAAVIIIGLAATIFGVFGPQLRQVHNAKRAAGCTPSAMQANIPANATLDDISLDSPTDGWAVGEITKPHGNTADPASSGSLLLHYQNCVWKEAAPSVPGVVYQSIVMNSPSDGWLVGGKLFGPNFGGFIYSSTFLMHYTGGRWQTVKTKIDTGSQGAYLRMSGPTDGWLLTAGGAFWMNELYHWQGSAWNKVTLPHAFQNGQIGGLAPSDGALWLIGVTYDNHVDNGSPLIGEYANEQWQTWELSYGPGQMPALAALHIDAAGHVWVLGRYPAPGSDSNPQQPRDLPYILRYNGINFDQIATSTTAPHSELLFTAAIDQPDGGIVAIGAASPVNASGMPETQLNALSLRCGPTASIGCQFQPFPLHNISLVDTISMDSPTQGFAIVLTMGQNGDLTSSLAYYDAGSWTLLRS
jgi:hypothetical protein